MIFGWASSWYLICKVQMEERVEILVQCVPSLGGLAWPLDES